MNGAIVHQIPRGTNPSPQASIRHFYLHPPHRTRGARSHQSRATPNRKPSTHDSRRSLRRASSSLLPSFVASLILERRGEKCVDELDTRTTHEERTRILRLVRLSLGSEERAKLGVRGEGEDDGDGEAGREDEELYADEQELMAIEEEEGDFVNEGLQGAGEEQVRELDEEN